MRGLLTRSPPCRLVYSWHNQHPLELLDERLGQGKFGELLKESGGVSPGGRSDRSCYIEGFSTEVGCFPVIDGTRKSSFSFSAKEGLMSGCLNVVVYFVRRRETQLLGSLSPAMIDAGLHSMGLSYSSAACPFTSGGRILRRKDDLEAVKRHSIRKLALAFSSGFKESTRAAASLLMKSPMKRL